LLEVSQVGLGIASGMPEPPAMHVNAKNQINLLIIIIF